MGANFSNPFDQAARERALEIIQDVCSTFTMEFLKGYKVCARAATPPPPPHDPRFHV